jgi:hypothetical protein
MAVQFLNDIDLNQNELIDAVIENQTGDTPAGTGVDGQLYYDTTLDVLKVWTGAAWTSVGSDTYTLTGTGAGNGTAKVRLSDGTTNNDVAFTGTGSVIVTRSGNTLTINGTDNQGVTIITAGAGITGSNLASSNPTIDVDYLGTDNVVLAATDGTAATVASTDRILINDSDDSNTVKYVNISQITAAIGGGTVTSVTAGTGMTQTGDDSVNPTLNVIGSSGILANADNIAIDYSGANNIIDSAAPGTTLVAADKFIAEDLSDNIVKEYTIQKILDLVPAGDTYDLRVSAGATAGARVNLDASAGTDTFTDFEGNTNTILITKTDGVNGEVAFDLQDNVTITTSLTVPTATVSGSASNALTITGKGRSAATIGTDNNLTLATKGYVDGLVEGGLTFLGTFRADSGEILSGGNDGSFLYNVPGGAGTRVAVAVGDYYVVATAGGNFYANATYPLDIGDSIIGVETAAADTSVVGDWSLVSQGVTVNSVNTTDGTYIDLTPNSATTGAVVVTADLSAVDGTAVSGTRFLSKDNTWDVPAYAGAMTQATLGLGRLRYNIGATPAAETQSTVANRTYGVTKNANNQLIVNVPWSDSNTGLTSVGITETGSALTITNSPLTANGNINIAGAGTASQVILGNLTLGTLTSGTVTSIATTGPITGGTITGSGTIGISNATSGAVGAARVSAGTGISVAVAGGNFTVTNTQNNSDNTFAETITDTDLTIDHNLGTTDVIVQLYDVTEGVTVYADVDRISANRIGVTFGSTPPNSVRVLVQKIG